MKYINKKIIIFSLALFSIFVFNMLSYCIVSTNSLASSKVKISTMSVISSNSEAFDNKNSRVVGDNAILANKTDKYINDKKNIISSLSEVVKNNLYTEKVININSKEDFLVFASHCRNDAYTLGKTINLNTDLDFKNDEFFFISTFAGKFNGNNKKISGLHFDKKQSIMALFLNVREGAVVQNLIIDVTIHEDNSENLIAGLCAINSGTIQECIVNGSIKGKAQIGGIVANNKETGVIKNCRFTGDVIGKMSFGGICGYNSGEISLCVNDGDINTIYLDEDKGIQDIKNLKEILDKNSTKEFTLTFKDGGGICGYSEGRVSACVNNGIVGYTRVGYNIGGIVGRNVGYTFASINNGKVFGRKDIGGVVGQNVPENTKQLIGSSARDIQKETNRLNELCDKSIQEMRYYSDNINATFTHAHGTMTDIKDSGLEKTRDYANTISALGKYMSTVEGLINELGSSVVTTGLDPSNPASLTTAAIANMNMNIIALALEKISMSGVLDGGKILQETAANTIGNLDDDNEQLTSLLTDLKLLNEELNAYSESLSTNLSLINKQMQVISNMVLEPMIEVEELNKDDYIEDVSSENDPNLITGKIYSCENKANVQADLNVGGICGCMDLEYEEDPESDTNATELLNLRSRYYRKSVLLSCTNQGLVLGKVNSIGGIVGNMNIGIVSSCNSYGFIDATDCENVGGIAGLSNSTVAKSFASGDIVGKKCVGGIVGKGETVRDCDSIANVFGEEFFGAISGYMGIDYENNFLRNCFVSDKLEGIDRFSFKGRAEKISYEALKKKYKNDPDKILKLKLRFSIIEDEDDSSKDVIVKDVSFEYGASFDNSIYPKVDSRDGYYFVWDYVDLNNLKCDTLVKGRYIEYITAIESTQKRDNNLAAFLVLSDFTNNDKFVVSKLEEETKKSSSWKFNISRELKNNAKIKIRFLPLPYFEKLKKIDVDYDVYVDYNDGKGKQKVQNTKFGSYIEFEVKQLDFTVYFKSNKLF